MHQRSLERREEPFLFLVFERVDADGNPAWVRGTYHPIMGANGVVYEILKIASDEIERVKAQVGLRSANT